MAVDPELLLRVLRSARGRPLAPEDILLRARLDPGMRNAVRQALRSLAREGAVEPQGRRFALKKAESAPPTPEPRPASMPQPVLPPRPANLSLEIVGTLTVHRDGYGFVASLHGGEDLFVPPSLVTEALDGDLARCSVGRGREGRPAARTLEVLERRRRFAVGSYETSGPRSLRGAGAAIVRPRDPRLGPAVMVPRDKDIADGEIVRVALEDMRDGTLRGRVAGRLGLPGQPDAEVLSVAYGEGFSDRFPADAETAAAQVPPEVRPDDLAGRRDLRGLDLVTVDGEDARDFDDAVFVERSPRGWRLVVAIADVAHYVPEGGALDREALRRATSVYFPQHVLPMLPEPLSAGICSLKPGVDRLCTVADLALDSAGHPLEAELYPAAMRSRARCTYTQVASLLAGDDVPELSHVAPMLRLAGELSAAMTEMRRRRGSIDFDLPEPHVVLADDGSVRTVERRERTAAHRLIEEFMLAANEAVARHFEARSLPVVYRVHGEPDDEKLAAFAALAGEFGHVLTPDEKGRFSSADLDAFLRRIEGRPEQRALNHLLLRSMMQAIYSSENIGHYGLAAGSYLHFTSPIRRYPDLVVHRLLRAHLERAGRVPAKAQRSREAARLEQIAVHCSERERAAMSAEREIDAYYAARLLQDRVGERFAGTVSSIAGFGIFVELDDPFVEGLVRAESVGYGWELDERAHRLRFGDGRSFGVGDRIEVVVEGADPVLRRIDLAPVREPRQRSRTRC